MLQIQWCILFVLIDWLIYTHELAEIFYDFYWFGMFSVACGVCAMFLVATKDPMTPMFIKLVGAFLSVFDIGTDIVLIASWMQRGHYFWVVLQSIILVAGALYGAFYIDDYYYIDKKEESDPKEEEQKKQGKAKRYAVFNSFS